MFRIIFDPKTNAYASKDLNTNLMFIRAIETATNDLLRIRGYVYINDVYEDLGVKWDPEQENLCYIYEEGKKINFKIAEQQRNTGKIVIDID